MKVTDKCSAQGEQILFICDFSPARSADPGTIDRAREMDADFISVAYNPGRAVRVDAAMLAASIKAGAGKDVTFTLGTRDMNKLALESHLLGAQLLGLDNVIVVRGDPFTQKDLSLVREAWDITPTGLIGAIASMNEGVDFRGLNLRAPTDFCVGASIDLGRGIQREAPLTQRKVSAGAQFFITQPVFDTKEIEAFLEEYASISGGELSHPVFFGLQVLEKDGVIFSSVPERVRQDLDKGREGMDIALEILQGFLDKGIRTIYLVPPILRGGARNYVAAQKVVEEARRR